MATSKLRLVTTSKKPAATEQEILSMEANLSSRRCVSAIVRTILRSQVDCFFSVNQKMCCATRKSNLSIDSMDKYLQALTTEQKKQTTDYLAA